METGKVFNAIARGVAGGHTIIINKGGMRSGKTFASLQFLIWYAQTFSNVVISVVGETIPFLKRGAIRDFLDITKGAIMPNAWNATDNVCTFPNGSKIEFFSADNDSKIHGAARDVLFINECFFIRFETYRQLSTRTRKLVLLDYNPRARFWVDDYLTAREDAVLIHSTYRDNPYLTPRQVAEIESYKSDANFWRVYGLGETGSVEGLIYTDWQQCDTLTNDYKKEFFCIDFGYTNDPTAILQVRQGAEALYIKEICYRPGMLNADIAAELKQAGATRYTPIVADSAERKSIDEINTHGFNIVPCVKGAGSISAGISAVQSYKLRITNDSDNLINELRNYMFKRDKDGNYLNEPIDKFNHALDALRYGVNTFLWVNPVYQKPRVRRIKRNYNE